MDVVDKLKQDLCNFARTKMNANYADCISLMNIVDKYNFEAGNICGVRVNCLTTHNRVLVIRYNLILHTCEKVKEMVENINNSIMDNTTSVVCIPDDVTVKSMTPESFQQLIRKLREMYRTSEQYINDQWLWDNQDKFVCGVDLSRYYPSSRLSSAGAGLSNITSWVDDRRWYPSTR